MFKRKDNGWIKGSLATYKVEHMIAKRTTSLLEPKLAKGWSLFKKQTADEVISSSDYLKMVADYKAKGLPMDELIVHEEKGLL